MLLGDEKVGGGEVKADRINHFTHKCDNWRLTPMGWIVVFCWALFVAGFVMGVWWEGAV